MSQKRMAGSEGSVKLEEEEGKGGVDQRGLVVEKMRRLERGRRWGTTESSDKEEGWRGGERQNVEEGAREGRWSIGMI